MIAEVCHCRAHDQMHVHLYEPTKPCRCGTEDLGGENLILNPFVLEGRHLHTADHCGRVETFGLNPPGSKWTATWSNPPETHS